MMAMTTSNSIRVKARRWRPPSPTFTRDLPANASGIKSQLIVRVHPADDGGRLRSYEFDNSVKIQIPGGMRELEILKLTTIHEMIE